MKIEIDAEIIIVGEEKLGDKLYLRGSTIGEKGLCLIGGLMLDESGYLIPEEDLEYMSCSAEYNIHKKYLNMRIIEDIQRINERLVG
jgi:hypothetical protein